MYNNIKKIITSEIPQIKTGGVKKELGKAARERDQRKKWSGKGDYDDHYYKLDISATISLS